jgi:hypothetical protein
LALLLVVAAGFVSAGIWIAPQNAYLGYSSIAFFGIGAIVVAVNLLPRSSYLLIDVSGFTFASFFRKHSVSWNKVERFVPVRIGTKQMVGWKYTSDHQGAKKLRSLNLSLMGAEAVLPDTYGKSVTELIALLEGFRSQYGRP